MYTTSHTNLSEKFSEYQNLISGMYGIAEKHGRVDFVKKLLPIVEMMVPNFEGHSDRELLAELARGLNNYVNRLADKNVPVDDLYQDSSQVARQPSGQAKKRAHGYEAKRKPKRLPDHSTNTGKF
ncbi:hypothetical protein SARC_13503 [Sphaeroforma arctica JP610]|uniref:Uncharacterized protein n=1 Tax=Sphaeroforma arctica JP610 TaxID=667725 RepID=A0A0L0FB21_9EUKA|nr:hypothetical protein SARC_13503 [Sphaeroforma arctica JP610]KNC73939.1 hypothetical protein SARC_13503 [Sphaeroforma arctica JP610]|eukprot:XP_014147841.1 hypothetical protein SARC_13503 [Sphaeroforma arctica JP610]